MNAEDEAAERSYRSDLPGLLGTLDTFLSRLEAFILASGVLLMAANTVANVVGRFVFGESISASGEINRVLIILITFAGIGYAARHGRHIRMSAIYDAFPVGGRKIAMILISLITSATMFFLLYFSVGYIIDVYGSGRVLPSLGFPVWTAYVWVPLGFGITGIQYLLTAVKNIREKDVYLSTVVVDGYRDTETEV
ncbi:TRAP transporter small permease [Spiribacter vilamensis]|uniref:TRAP transporter small permease protein n=1 Tax=Spiribacter vilamensis TaxID=531306 RepID=A0A4Q8D1K7_9GAMM|nr:TRAP transporter small permease [Spiribacter vilamensis]RZU99140.1 TRAP-type C4-dicarboxylate transport system permease small subunit [Spiribacter vilamensis]TVO61865.1 TRAP transporter small permease [Spiribacter vilamensis]